MDKTECINFLHLLVKDADERKQHFHKKKNKESFNYHKGKFYAFRHAIRILEKLVC